MKTMHYCVSTLSIAALVAGTALANGAAPIVHGAVGAVGGVTGGLSIGGGNPAAAMAAGSFHSSAGVAGGASGAAHAGGEAFSGGASGGATSDEFESIGMRQARLQTQTTVNPLADAHASARAHEVSPRFASSSSASAALDATATAAKTRAATIETREDTIAEIKSRIKASDKDMSDLKVEAKENGPAAQAEFKAAAKDVAASEKELKRSMKAADKASADTWADSRTKLAADYEAYASAMAHAETAAAARAMPATPAEPNGAGQAATPANPATPSINSTTHAKSDAVVTTSK